DGKENRHTRVAFILTGGRRLLYNDQRRFGQLRVVKRLDEVGYLNVLGPEPFADEFSADYMRENFLKSSRPIKNMLLDHTFVAGIGNIYACEMLFKSGIDPRRPACRITKEKIGILHQIISEVLQEAILHRGSSLRNYRDGMGRKGSFTQRLAVYGREGCPCLRCGDPVRRIIQAGRSTFYCGHCQK
ncbi:MAG: DNA-formamidopyrimidine glycosylase, partial [Candidatus Omnitrophica bacterium]|nr:DNA-formamidopyrimidine glycosylase [Candidatus Omnitrophota bacterium]